MFKLLKKELYRDLRNKGMLIFLAASIILCFFFWNSLGEVNAYNNLAKIKKAHPQDYSKWYMSYGWQPSAEDPEEAFAEFVEYIESMRPEFLLKAVSRIFTEVNPIVFLAIYAAAYLIAASFSGRCMSIDIADGYSRGSVFMAKVLHYYLVILITLLFAFFAYLFFLSGFRWLAVFQLYHLRGLGIWLYLSLAIVSVPLLLGFVFKGVFKMLVASIIFIFTIPFLPMTAYYGADKLVGLIGTGMFDWLPMAMAGRDVLHKELFILSSYESFMLIAVPLAFLLGTALISYAFFRRAELK